MTLRAGDGTVPAMPEITVDQLAQLLAHLRAGTEESLDELLTDFLVVPYPTRLTQDN
jgi:hypothetical protein